MFRQFALASLSLVILPNISLGQCGCGFFSHSAPCCYTQICEPEISGGCTEPCARKEASALAAKNACGRGLVQVQCADGSTRWVLEQRSGEVVKTSTQLPQQPVFQAVPATGGLYVINIYSGATFKYDEEAKKWEEIKAVPEPGQVNSAEPTAAEPAAQ